MDINESLMRALKGLLDGMGVTPPTPSSGDEQHGLQPGVEERFRELVEASSLKQGGTNTRDLLQGMLRSTGMSVMRFSGRRALQTRAVEALLTRGMAEALYRDIPAARRYLKFAYTLGLRIGYPEKAVPAARVLEWLAEIEIRERPSFERARPIADVLMDRGLWHHRARFWSAKRHAWRVGADLLLRRLQEAGTVERSPLSTHGDELLLVNKVLIGVDLRTLGGGDAMVATEMHWRDLARGLRLLGQWREVISLFSEHHHMRILPERDLLPLPITRNPGEVALHLVLGASEDPIGVAISPHGASPFFVDLETTVQELQETTAWFKVPGWSLVSSMAPVGSGPGDLAALVEQIDHMQQAPQRGLGVDPGALNLLWDRTFGARISRQWDGAGEPDDKHLGRTLFEVLHFHSATRLRVVPEGYFNSLPLSAARRLEGGRLRYAIEDFDFRYHVAWRVPPSDEESDLDWLLLTDVSPATGSAGPKLRPLDHAYGEVEMAVRRIGDRTRWLALRRGGWQGSAQPFPNGGDFQAELLAVLRRARHVYVAAHVEDQGLMGGAHREGAIGGNRVLLANGAQPLSIGVKELSSVRLPRGCEVLLNCCHGETTDFGTHLEDHNLAPTLLAAGASVVVSTMLPVNDAQAAQIGVRIQELMVKQGCSLADAAETALRDASAEGWEPVDDFDLQLMGQMSSSRSERNGASTEDGMPTWASYMIWEAGH